MMMGELLLHLGVGISGGILYGLVIIWRTGDRNLGIATSGLMGMIIFLGNW